MSGAAPTAGPPARSGGAGAKAFVQRNKVPLAVAGAAGVAGLALLRSRQGSGEKGSATTAAGTGRLAAQGGVYDSSSSDAYNALQPAIEKVSNQYDDLKALLQGRDMTTPVPAPGGGGAATSDITTGAAAPRPTSSAPLLTGITTDYGSNTGSIYNAVLSNGTTTPINENAVWSGAFGGGYGTSAGGLGAAQADQVRDALASKGLGYGREGNTGGGYTEESAGGRVVQGYR